MSEKKYLLGFPPDDDSNNLTPLQIKLRAVKHLNESQTKFILEKIIEEFPDLVEMLKARLRWMQENPFKADGTKYSSEDQMLSAEVKSFRELCKKMGISNTEYSVAKVFIKLVDLYSSRDSGSEDRA